MSGLAHVFHLVMTLIFLPWLLVWIVCAVSASNKVSRQDRKLQERQVAALEEMNRVNKYKGWMDK